MPSKFTRETEHVSVMQSVMSETPWAFAFCLSAVLQEPMPNGLQQQPPEPIVHTAGKKLVQGCAGLILSAGCYSGVVNANGAPRSDKNCRKGFEQRKLAKQQSKHICSCLPCRS